MYPLSPHYFSSVHHALKALFQTSHDKILATWRLASRTRSVPAFLSPKTSLDDCCLSIPVYFKWKLIRETSGVARLIPRDQTESPSNQQERGSGTGNRSLVVRLGPLQMTGPIRMDRQIQVTESARDQLGHHPRDLLLEATSWPRGTTYFTWPAFLVDSTCTKVDLFDDRRGFEECPYGDHWDGDK